MVGNEPGPDADAGAARRRRLADARLYFVAGDRPGGRPLEDVLRPALAGGIDLFQLRMKDADDEAVLRAAEQARRLCAEAGALFLLNDRPDLAARAGADGVHLGQEDLPVDAARASLGPDALVGLSTHAPEQLAAAPVDADYVVVGPVHETPTKPGRPATGLVYVRHAAASERRPWFAIGGIGPDTIDDAVAAGARRVVVVRAIAEAADPEAAARALRGTLDAAGDVDARAPVRGIGRTIPDRSRPRG